MAYNTVPTVTTGDLWTAAMHNTYIKDNFAAGVPAIFTTKGDLAVASGSMAAARLAAGADGKVLIPDSSQALGMLWANPWMMGFAQAYASETSEASGFATTETSFTDITGATLDLVLAHKSTVILMASGNLKADYTSGIVSLRGVIGTVEDTAGVSRMCHNSSYDPRHVPFGYVFYAASVAAGTVTIKLQLKSSTASMTARCGKINLMAIGFYEG